MIMEPADLLDVLGNENRRRILQLLSFRPFYFNEIAKRLDVGPKAVIDHLEMLERAGLIECYQEQGRRKYFRIVRKIVLEVAVSPHSYGVRAFRSEGAPAPRSSPPQDMKILWDELGRLEERRRDLRALLEDVESKQLEIKTLAARTIQDFFVDKLEAEILIALLSGGSTAASLAQRLGVPAAVVAERLQDLLSRGAVQQWGEEWRI
jgi:ArsR family transcriptional regulator